MSKLKNSQPDILIKLCAQNIGFISILLGINYRYKTIIPYSQNVNFVSLCRFPDNISNYVNIKCTYLLIIKFAHKCINTFF